LLRRTKEEVAVDLPPKTVIDERIPLESKQTALYETLRVAMDARVRKAIKEKGIDKSRITILDALLKLRQACCDPSLVKLDAANKVKESAKRARLMALLDELMAEGRKVLIFSQFVEMLKLIEADVKAQGWRYTMLTGRTRKRDEAVEAFQQGDAQLFLISLKAGGTGLTLTEADTVILFDPWWNPAVERQAMDRARIRLRPQSRRCRQRNRRWPMLCSRKVREDGLSLARTTSPPSLRQSDRSLSLSQQRNLQEALLRK